MFEVNKASENRLHMRLDGKLDADQMRTALDELINKSQHIEDGCMLYQIDDFDMPSLGAIGVELARLPALLRTIRRFDRAAIVADKRWIRRIGELEGHLIPGLEIRGFENCADAEAWLAN